MNIRQYGTWPSPVSSRTVGASLNLGDVQWADDTLVWLEGRGAQGVLVMQRGVDAPCDLTTELAVRARVGYGGGDFTAAAGLVYFAGPEGRIYRQALNGGSAQPVTPAFGAAASPTLSPDGRWLVYVHSYEGRDVLAIVDSMGEAWPAKLAQGTDFVMQPVWHPQGMSLACVVWNHPMMPWDGTELRLLHFDYDSGGIPVLMQIKTLAGDEQTAIFQPAFSPDGRYLAYISDASGWSQLYLYDLREKTHRQLTSGDYDLGTPAWAQGLRSYGWLPDSQRLCVIHNEEAFHSLRLVDAASGEMTVIGETGAYTHLRQPAVSPVDGTIAVIASASSIPARLITVTPPEMDIPAVLNPDAPGLSVLVADAPQGDIIRRRSSAERLLPGQLSTAEAVRWAGHDGETVYGLYYPPASDQFTGEGAPPLIVQVHGGPTGQAQTVFNGGIQFFTSRGYAVLTVNYRGSTGYGKPYMNRLRGNWGVYDVEDSSSGAAFLAGQGKADGEKLVIMGGSAGGFTVLQSLIEKPGFYRAGICSYGVANLFSLAMETHKFEQHYTDSLVGPLPEAAALYRQRSAYFHAQRIVDPLLVFQGEDDQVVPRNQSDGIVGSLRVRGVPHEYHVYAGEGHGWRKPETIEHYYSTILQFLMQYVIFR